MDASLGKRPLCERRTDLTNKMQRDSETAYENAATGARHLRTAERNRRASRAKTPRAALGAGKSLSDRGLEVSLPKATTEPTSPLIDRRETERSATPRFSSANNRRRFAPRRLPQSADSRPARVALPPPPDAGETSCASITRRCGPATRFFQSGTRTTFGSIEHRGYQRVTRELAALQIQLRDGRKFEKLARYGCANLFFLVVPDDLLRKPEPPIGWGLLVAREGALKLHRKPTWHDSPERSRLRVLQKIAGAGTRQFNRQLGVVPAPFSSTSSFPQRSSGIRSLDEWQICSKLLPRMISIHARPVRSRSSVRLLRRSFFVAAFCQTQKNSDQMVRSSLLFEFSISR